MKAKPRKVFQKLPQSLRDDLLLTIGTEIFKLRNIRTILIVLTVIEIVHTILLLLR